MKKAKTYMSVFLLSIIIAFFYLCTNNQGTNDDYEFVTLSGGTFQMGSERGDLPEKPVHSVTLNDFEIGKYEVTNSQYCEFLNAKGNYEGEAGTLIYLEKSKIEKKNNLYAPKSGFEYHPVVTVSWKGATAYANWKDARLPTEAEWEYAARGGVLTKGYSYSGSNQVMDVAWYGENAKNKTHPIGQRKPNELGLHDMSGNVWEWCSDWYNEDYYQISPQQNPSGAESGDARVLRGGGYLFDENYCRVSNRYSISPNARNTRIGFRLAKSL